MFVVTVLFELHTDHAPAFQEAVIANARASREREAGCRQFDVVAVTGGSSIFLYEVYDDRAAFDAHLASPHFLEFDRRTRGWVARKDVQLAVRLDP
jgi:quinol monooxygenase YgiN